MNLYRGCSHGCIYCDSRSTCYGMDHAFEDIEVKINGPELLEQALKRRRKRCMIGTGAMCDPYMPCLLYTSCSGLQALASWSEERGLLLEVLIRWCGEIIPESFRPASPFPPI